MRRSPTMGPRFASISTAHLINTATGAHTTTNNPLLFGTGTYPPASTGTASSTKSAVQPDPVADRDPERHEHANWRRYTGNKTTDRDPDRPATGATFTAPAIVTLSAVGERLGRHDCQGASSTTGRPCSTPIPTSPYTSTWSSVAAGTYTVKAVAYDNSGASGSSTAASITISGREQAADGDVDRVRPTARRSPRRHR